jgi:hypothetical protein
MGSTDFIIGVSKSKMECISPIAMITAKYPLCLRFDTIHKVKRNLDIAIGDHIGNVTLRQCLADVDTKSGVNRKIAKS